MDKDRNWLKACTLSIAIFLYYFLSRSFYVLFNAWSKLLLLSIRYGSNTLFRGPSHWAALNYSDNTCPDFVIDPTFLHYLPVDSDTNNRLLESARQMRSLSSPLQMQLKPSSIQARKLLVNDSISNINVSVVGTAERDPTNRVPSGSVGHRIMSMNQFKYRHLQKVLHIEKRIKDRKAKIKSYQSVSIFLFKSYTSLI